MTWHPARSATQEQSERAMQLLKSSVADGSWAPGAVLAEENGVQYRANWHPNHNGPGQHQGVEVWLPQASETTMTAPWKPNPANRASAEERELVLAEFEKRGWPRDEANAMVSIESGWDPTARNSMNFGGLIGFAPWLQKKWGVYPVWNLSAAQQAPLVGRYLDENVSKKWRVPGDTYMTGAAPSFVGAPDDTVVYPKGSKAWAANKGWWPPDGGDITAGSIRATLLRRLAQGGAGPTPTPKELPGSGSSGLDFLELLHSAMAREHSYAHLEGGPKALLARYQAEHGLGVDGILGPETLGTLIDELSK